MRQVVVIIYFMYYFLKFPPRLTQLIRLFVIRFSTIKTMALVEFQPTNDPLKP